MPAVDGGRISLPDQKGARPYSGLWFRSVAEAHPRRLEEGRIDARHAIRVDVWKTQGLERAAYPVPGVEKEFSLKRKLLKDEIVTASVGRKSAPLSRRQAAKIISSRR